MKKITASLLLFMMLLFIIPDAFGGEPETLIGFTLNFDKKEITIKVASNGCTTKDDFQFTVNNGNVTVIRVKKDTCKAMPEVVTFTYTLTETGIDPNKPFRITNKFIVNPNIATIL